MGDKIKMKLETENQVDGVEEGFDYGEIEHLFQDSFEVGDAYADEEYVDDESDEMDSEFESILENDEIFDDRSNDIFDADGNMVLTNGESNFTLEYISIENIVIGRRIRNKHNISTLTKSVKTTGLLVPIIVAPTKTDYIYALVDGLDRLIAAAKNGITDVPCIIIHNLKTTELLIVEAMYNKKRSYTVKEIIEYIEYLENERNITNQSTIEFLLGMENGDSTKLKDLLNDGDEKLLEQLYTNQLSIGQAFKKMEARRRKESADEKELRLANKVYANTQKSGISTIDQVGEISGDTDGLTDDEVERLSLSPNIINDDSLSLSEMVNEGNSISGFEPKVQDVNNREYIDPALRKAVMARDNYTCQCCGIGGPLYIECMDFHHILPVYLGGEDSVDNAEVLCIICHKLVHLHGRGELFAIGSEHMSEEEEKKFREIVKRGNFIREGINRSGIELKEYKKSDNVVKIGRQKPGQVSNIS